jgi:putative ABC transport system permease protein
MAKALMSALMQDVRYGIRQLSKARAFTAAVVATLGLAVGANTLLFAIANATIVRVLPYRDSQHIVSMTSSARGVDTQRIDEPTARLAASAAVEPFDAVAIYDQTASTLTNGSQPERLTGALVGERFFEVFQTTPRLGRTFTAEERREGGPGAVILSDGLWTRRFAGDPTVIGRSIQLDGRTLTIVGVMPRGFAFPGRSEFWMPHLPRRLAGGGYFFADAVGRLRAGSTPANARDALLALRRAHAAELPAPVLATDIIVLSLQRRLYGDFRRPLLILGGVVVCVLLIACANITNLLLARATARQTELSIRIAIGATRARLFRQLAIESLLLAVLGLLPAMAVSAGGLRLVRAFGPPTLARMPELAIDWRVFEFSVLVTVATGLLFGLAPAFAAARTPPLDALKTARLAGRSSGRPRRALVVLEIAAAIVLTLGAALLVKSFARYLGVDRGFRPAGVLTGSIALPRATYPTDEARRSFHDRTIERVRAIPGVESASLSAIGLSGMSMTVRWPSADGAPEASNWTVAIANAVGVDHFRTYGIPIVEGGECPAVDMPVAVVNQALARRAFPGRSALGERLPLPQIDSPTIVGVAADVRRISDNAPPDPLVYACARRTEAPSAVTVALRVRPAIAAQSLAPALRAAVAAVDPQQPVTRVTTVEDAVREGVSARWFDAGVIVALAMLALALAMVGLYGLIAYQVAQRTSEIGVRMALGADRGAVRRLILREGCVLTALGVGIGLTGSLPLVTFIRTMLFDVQPLDRSVYALVPLIVAVVALLATSIPASRAARIDPLAALRSE